MCSGQFLSQRSIVNILTLTCLLLHSRLCIHGQPPLYPAFGHPLIVGRCEPNGEPIRLDVTLGERRGVFAIDTGSSGTVLAPRMLSGDATLLGKVSVPTLHGEINAPLYAVDGLKVADVNCTWVRKAIVLDLSHYHRNIGVNIDGILGIDFLSVFVLHMDFDSGTLLLCDPGKVGGIAGSEAGLVWQDEWCPCINAKVNASAAARFAIDTGLLSTGRISEKLASAHLNGSGNEIIGRMSSVDATGKSFVSASVRCRNFAIGEHVHSGLTFATSKVNAIGLFYLYRYKITLDFPRAKSYWIAGSRFNCLDRGDGCGIATTLTPAGELVISDVAKGSLGDIAGLEPGDRIREINGAEFRSGDLARWNRLRLVPSNESLKLSLDRSGRLVTIQMGGTP